MTGSIDLNPNHLATVERILAEHVPECEVRAFGSRATWTAKDYSDIDLAIVGEGLLEWRTLGRLKEAFEESSLPMRVDVLDWHDISDSFQKVIERDYVVLQKGAKKKVHLAGSASAGSPSGAATLAVSAGDWREVTLGDVVHLHTEQVNPAHYPGRLFRHFSIPAFDENHAPAEELDAEIGSNKFTVPADSILVSRLNPRIPRVWEPTVEDGDFAIASTEFLVLLPRGIDRRFLKYLCLDPKMRSGLEGMATGTSGSHQRVRPRDVLNIRIPLPPLPEQRAIAHVLGTLDDKIELNRRMNETLEAMARALFKSWFVDFEPVRAKIEGRWRPGESLPGLPADLYDLFPDRLVDSELGEVPEGWEVKALPEIMDYKEGPGIRHWQYTNSAEGTRFINIRCIQDGDILLNKANRIGTEEADGKYAHFHLKEWDIVVSTSGTLGRSAVVRRSHLPVVLNTSVIRFRPIDDVASFSFLHGYLNSPIFLNELELSASGSVQKNFGPMHLRTIRMLCPPYDCLQRYDEMAGSLIRQVIAKRAENDALTSQRDALLPGLVSGEVRVGGRVSTPWRK